MEIKVKEFKKALEIVKPGLANKEETIDQVTSFAFTGNNVITYNDSICIYHPLKGIELTGAVKAEELYKFLNRINTDTIKVDIKEDSLTFKSGRKRAQFNKESEILLPLDDKKLTKKGKWFSIGEDFLDAVKMAVGSAAKSASAGKLACIHISEKGYIEGSDGYRLLRYKLKDKLKIKNDVVPPASSMSIVLKMNPTKMAVGRGWVHFKNKEGTTISCRVLDEDYIDEDKRDILFKTKDKGIKLDFPKELSEILTEAEIFSANGEVIITVNKKKLIITSKSESSNFKDEIDIKSKSDDFAFQVTPYLLQDILKQTTSSKIFKDRLLFEGESWKYVSLISMVEDDVEEDDLPF